MKSLDPTTVSRTCFDALKTRLSIMQQQSLLDKTGFETIGDVADSLARELCLIAHEEDYNSYLTKGGLRAARFGGLMPEHIIDTIVNTHLQNDLNNTNPIDNFKEKDMTEEISAQKYNALQARDRIHYKDPNAAQKQHSSFSQEELQQALQYLEAQRMQAAGGFAPQVGVPNNNAFLDAFKHVGTTIGGQLKGAVTAEVSARINRALVGYARQAFPQLPQGPAADTVLGFAIPSILLLIAHSVREAGPESIGISRQITDGVETTAKAALAGVSRDAISTAVEQAVPMLSFVAAMSAGNIPDQLTDGEQAKQARSCKDRFIPILNGEEK